MKSSLSVVSCLQVGYPHFPRSVTLTRSDTLADPQADPRPFRYLISPNSTDFQWKVIKILIWWIHNSCAKYSKWSKSWWTGRTASSWGSHGLLSWLGGSSLVNNPHSHHNHHHCHQRHHLHCHRHRHCHRCRNHHHHCHYCLTWAFQLVLLWWTIIIISAIVTIIMWCHCHQNPLNIMTMVVHRYAPPGEKPHYVPSFERTNWQLEQVSPLIINWSVAWYCLYSHHWMQTLSLQGWLLSIDQEREYKLVTEAVAVADLTPFGNLQFTLKIRVQSWYSHIIWWPSVYT